MTNRLAIVLGLLLIVMIVGDIAVYGDDHMIFLSKKLFDLVEWVAFWR